MERIPVWEGYNAVAFARSDAAKAMVQGGVDHFLNPMNAIEEAATRQKGEIDKALSILRNLPVTRISAYVEKHPELKKLLGLV